MAALYVNSASMVILYACAEPNSLPKSKKIFKACACPSNIVHNSISRHSLTDIGFFQMTSPILSVPPEVTERIFQHCDTFPQLWAVVSTCKHLFAIWEANHGSIIQCIGRRSIASFDKALIAVSIPSSSLYLSNIKCWTFS